MAIAGKTGTRITAEDAPFSMFWFSINGQRFDAYRIHREDHFEMYLMFKPDGHDSAWVPLKMMKWWWKGDAEKFGLGAVIVPGSNDQGKDAAAADTSDHPEWTVNVAHLMGQIEPEN